LLSNITSYTGVILTTHYGQGKFKHIQLIHMSAGQAMVVVVTDAGTVHHRIIEIPESICPADLETISSVLNYKLHGKNIENIRLTLVKEIYFELAKQKHVLNLAMDVIRDSLSVETGEKIYLGGIFNILNQPEFNNIEKVKTLLSLLEHENEIADIMTDVFHNEGVTVRIGEEMVDDRMKEYSMVMGSYHMEGRPVGAVGLLGPTRMDYARAFAVVEYMTRNLSLVMERLLRRRGK